MRITFSPFFYHFKSYVYQHITRYIPTTSSLQIYSPHVRGTPLMGCGGETKGAVHVWIMNCTLVYVLIKRCLLFKAWPNLAYLRKFLAMAEALILALLRFALWLPATLAAFLAEVVAASVVVGSTNLPGINVTPLFAR